jgi:diadenosine tetraphosphate (Ap4A) HIT family hydrolase
MPSCPLCETESENVLWNDARCRVVLVDDADYAGFCRVIWQTHVKEMTDLAAADQLHLFAVVLAVEAQLRELMQPAKINLASLGNQVPHLHWHVIPRFVDDAHFPDPIWAARKRKAPLRDIDVFRLAQGLAAKLSG